MKGCRIAVLQLVAAACLTACQSTKVAPIPASDGSFAPETDERKLWDQAGRLDRRIEEVGMIYSNVELQAYIGSVAMRLAEDQLARSGLELKVRVLQMPYRNAFVFPNGIFYISTGMLACLDNESELAAVLGHELTHFIRRHSLKESRSAANKEAWLNVVGGTTMLIGVAPLVAGVGAAWANSAILGYSRELENEADEVGLEEVARAGYDPRSSVKVLESIREEDKLLESETVKRPDTHPQPQERIDHCNALLGSRYLGSADESGFTINRWQYMTQVRQVLLDNAVLDIEARRLDFAQRAVDKYIAEWPDSAPGYFMRGEICRHQRGSEALVQAEAAYRRAVQLDPTYAEPHRELGLLHRLARRPKEARDELATYVALAPDAIDAGIFRSYVKELDGEPAGPKVR